MKTGKSRLRKLGVGVFASLMLGVAANAGVISAGYYDSFGAKADNSLMAWGFDGGNHGINLLTQSVAVANAQLGLGSTNGMVLMNGEYVVVAPKQSGTAMTWVDAVGSDGHGFGIQSDGSLWGWGYDGTPTATYLSGGAVNDLNNYHFEQAGLLGMGAPLCQTISRVSTNPVIICVTNVPSDPSETYVVVSLSMVGIYTSTVMNGLTTDQPAQVGSNLTWRQVAAGDIFSLGLQADGSIWSWGTETMRQEDLYDTNVPPGITGHVFYANGQLGQGDMLVTTTNVGRSDAVQLLMQFYTNISGTYTLYFAATNTWDIPAVTNVSQYLAALNTPTKIMAPTSMVCVSAGSDHSVAVGSDGSLWTWGVNQRRYTVSGTNWGSYGYATGCVLGLGDITLAATNRPTQIGTETTWASVSAGMNDRFTLAIKKDGSLWGWGDNRATYTFDLINGSNVFRAYALGCLGLGSNVLFANTPTQVGTDKDWAMVSAGNWFSVGLKSDGSLYAWGYNGGGNLGIGRVAPYVAEPTRIGTDNDWIFVSAGYDHSLALKSDGSLWGWGNNSFAALGDQAGNALEPVKIGDGYGASLPVIAAMQNGGGDYDGDHCTDFVFYDASTGNWAARLSQMGYVLLPLGNILGGPGYRLVTADFDGDGLTDPAVYQESSGNWQVLLSNSGWALNTTVFGGSGYMAVPADFDGDGKADFAVYNKTTGDWHIRLSEVDLTIVKNLGAGCVPVPMDYDGDHKADLAVYQAATGNWQVMMSRYGDAIANISFGGNNYAAVPMDYDGDGLADAAIYEKSTGVWVIMLSRYGWMIYDSAIYGWGLGGTGYVATPADYDGDGLADPTVFDMTDGQWTIMLSHYSYMFWTSSWTW